MDITTETLFTAGGVLIALAAAWNVIWSAIKNAREAKSPCTVALEKLAKHAEMLDRDNQRLRILEDGQKLQLKALKQLLRHEVDGNHVDLLESVESEIDTYLINR